MLLTVYTHPDKLTVTDETTLHFSEGSGIWNVHVFLTPEQCAQLVTMLAPAEVAEPAPAWEWDDEVPF